MKKKKAKQKLTLKNYTNISNSFKIILAISVSDKNIKKQCTKESSRGKYMKSGKWCLFCQSFFHLAVNSSYIAQLYNHLLCFRLQQNPIYTFLFEAVDVSVKRMSERGRGRVI